MKTSVLLELNPLMLKCLLIELNFIQSISEGVCELKAAFFKMGFRIQRGNEVRYSKSVKADQTWQLNRRSGAKQNVKLKQQKSKAIKQR